jgi:hypothetical protein
MMPGMRRLLLVAAAALVLAAIDQFLFHGVRVTESYIRVPLG